MTTQEKHALRMELHTPRGGVFITFLKELAIENAMRATNCSNADEAFGFSMRAKGQFEAQQTLEAIANEDISGAYEHNAD